MGFGNSASEAKCLDQGSVSVNVFVGEVTQQPAALADDHLQAAPACGVVLVNLEVFSKFPDPFRQNCDLDLGGTSILLVLAKLLDRLRLSLGFQSFLFRASAVRKFGFVDDLPLLRPASAFFSLFLNSANSFSSNIKDTTRYFRFSIPSATSTSWGQI